ncbi:hypothetical protein D3C71_1775430 [compost metagenome]
MNAERHRVARGHAVLQPVHFVVVGALEVFKDVARHALGVAKQPLGRRAPGIERIQQVHHIADIAQRGVTLHG